MYIMGRTTTWPAMAMGRSTMPCMPSTPLCGGFTSGVESRDPYTPPLVMVKVPPVRSSGRILFSLARLPNSAMARSMSAKLMRAVLRSTGTTRPRPPPMATPMSW